MYNGSLSRREKIMRTRERLESALYWIRLSPLALTLTALFLAVQLIMLLFPPRAPEGAVVISSKPEGAGVYLKRIDLGGLSLLPVGKTPGPLHLDRRDFPGTLVFRLWGYREEVRFVRRESLFDARTSQILTMMVNLAPRNPLVPCLYSFRDYPLLYLALISFLLYLLRVRNELARMKKARLMAMRLEFGDFAPGVEIGPYRIERLVGTGGMARVYLAVRRDEERGERLALKILAGRHDRDAEFYKRFTREVNICRALQHPHIVHLLDWGEISGYLYLVLEFIDGESLAERMGKERISLDCAVKWLREISEALYYAHSSGIIHRDIKPGNIMISGDGRARLMDFGIARRTDLPILTQSGQGLGTPAYASPEQIRGGRIDWRADYYSLGIMAYELLSGRHPFPGVTGMELMHRHLDSDPPSLGESRPGLPESLVSAVQAMISKNPKDRARRIDDISKKLGEIERSLPGTEPNVTR
jgi:hypothetical protein